MLDFTLENISAEDVERLRALYEPLAQSVRELIDATVRTQADAATVAAAKSEIDSATARLRQKQLDGSFGVRYLATLFGLTLLSHQIGGFFGAWLGGLAVARFGDYTWMWYADAGLALFAALVNLPIREARVLRAVPA